MSHGERNSENQSHSASAHAQMTIHQEASWEGPLPPPSQLAKFNEVLPGLAECIVRMAEQEGEHLREVQLRAVKGAVWAQRIGQVFALFVAMGGLYIAYHLAMTEHDTVAGIVAGTTICVVVGAFLQYREKVKANQS